MADVMTFVIVTGTPGIFGFLIWELKENWRLFAANRPRTCGPCSIGGARRDPVAAVAARASIPARFPSVSPSSAAPSGRRLRRRRSAARSASIARCCTTSKPICSRYVEREFIAWFDEEPRLDRCPARRWTRSTWPPTTRRVEVVMPGAVEGPLVMAFQLVDGRTHLELSGKACARKAFRTRPGRSSAWRSSTC